MEEALKFAESEKTWAMKNEIASVAVTPFVSSQGSWVEHEQKFLVELPQKLKGAYIKPRKAVSSESDDDAQEIIERCRMPEFGTRKRKAEGEPLGMVQGYGSPQAHTDPPGSFPEGHAANGHFTRELVQARPRERHFICDPYACLLPLGDRRWQPDRPRHRRPSILNREVHHCDVGESGHFVLEAQK
jgi:hypothetical protein